MSQIILDKVIAPSAPSTGSIAVYVKSDGKLYLKDEFGVEALVAASNISSLTSLDYADFDTATSFANLEGRMTWNSVDGTLNLGLKGGNVTLQLGQEQVIRIYNNTGTTFSAPHVVRITGSQAQRLTVGLALSNSEPLSASTFAVVTEQIPNNSEGFATVSGLVRDINTTAFAEGASLYLSPTVPGGITSVKPIAPNRVIHVGWCIRSHVSLGSIFVNVLNGFEVEELHNVLISNVANNDVLAWDATTSLWKNKTNNVTATTLKTTNYSVLLTDYVIRVDSTSNPVTITLPTAIGNAGRSFIIKKINPSTNSVTISTILSQTIDGLLSVIVNTQYSFIRVHSNGTSWDII